MEDFETLGAACGYLSQAASDPNLGEAGDSLARCGDEMHAKDVPSTSYTDRPIDVKLKLSALWGATVLCYIYGDLFGFFKQQTVTEIASGKAGPIGTQAGLLAAALSVAVPSVMVILALILKPPLCRWLNILLGIAYTLVALVTMPGAWMYYILLGAIEIVLTLSIVWHAWHWPRESANRTMARTIPSEPHRSDR